MTARSLYLSHWSARMIGFPLGLLYWNAGEWLLHKHVLHGLGRRRTSFFAYHWHEHHREARRGFMFDSNYERPALGFHSQGKEVLGLAAVVAFHLPLFPIAPFFTAALVYSAIRYHRVHKRAHLDPDWAREHLPWHVDHHLGPNQHANWCVTWPLFDALMGTCEPYVGTTREARDVSRSFGGGVVMAQA